MLKGIILD